MLLGNLFVCFQCSPIVGRFRLGETSFSPHLSSFTSQAWEREMGQHPLINRSFLNIHFFIRKYVNLCTHPHSLLSLLRRCDTVSYGYLLLHLLDCATFSLSQNRNIITSVPLNKLPLPLPLPIATTLSGSFPSEDSFLNDSSALVICLIFLPPVHILKFTFFVYPTSSSTGWVDFARFKLDLSLE